MFEVCKSTKIYPKILLFIISDLSFSIIIWGSLCTEMIPWWYCMFQMTRVDSNERIYGRSIFCSEQEGKTFKFV